MKNPPAVRQILGEYFQTAGLEVSRTDNPADAVLSGSAWQDTLCEVNDYHWPQAARWDRFREDDDEEGTAELMFEHGDQEFVELLSRLGPHLDSELVVQATRQFGEGSAWAAEWRVKPGSTEVLVTRFEDTPESNPIRGTHSFTGSTTPEVKDPEGVQSILDGWYRSFSAHLWSCASAAGRNPVPRLSIRGGALPRAVRLTEHGVPPTADIVEKERCLSEHGAEGFKQLLRELAPHLKATLVVHYFCYESTHENAEARVVVWRIQPGSSSVEVETLGCPDQPDDEPAGTESTREGIRPPERADTGQTPGDPEATGGEESKSRDGA